MTTGIFKGVPKPGDWLVFCDERQNVCDGPYKILVAWESEEDYRQLRYKLIDALKIVEYRPRSKFLGGHVTDLYEKTLSEEQVSADIVHQAHQAAMIYRALICFGRDAELKSYWSFDPQDSKYILTLDQLKKKSIQ